MRLQKYSVLTMMIVVLAACASTRIDSAWRDRDYDARITKMFVIGLSDNLSARRLYEDTLGRHLRERNVEAVAASSVLPADRPPDRDMVETAVRGKGYDAVLVTQVVGIQRDPTVIHGGIHTQPQTSHRNFYDYYDRTQPPPAEPRAIADTIVRIETSVYETADGNLVWAVTSETFNPDKLEEVIDAIARVIVNRLEADGLIAR